LKRITLAALAVAIAAAFAGPASAAEPANMVGACSVDGHATFSPDLGNLPVDADWHYVARGTCTGSVNGQTVQNTPVEYEITAHGPVSCTFGYTLAAPQTITFEDTSIPGDRTLTGTFNLVQTAGANNDVMTGDAGGTAGGETTFFQNGVDGITQKCSTGTVDQFDATVTWAGDLSG
jgi:hypothetical protein